jgi:hypothetical protein
MQADFIPHCTQSTKARAQHEAPQIYSPDDLNMVGLGPDPEVLSTCGKQVFEILNDKGDLVSPFTEQLEATLN